MKNDASMKQACIHSKRKIQNLVRFDPTIYGFAVERVITVQLSYKSCVNFYLKCHAILAHQISNSHCSLSLLQSSIDSEDTACHVCGRKAESHCIDCNKSLCQPCQTYHDGFTKYHLTVSIHEFQSGQISTEGRVCNVHHEKVMYYCETEQKQVCTSCINVKTCLTEHTRVTLKEAADKHITLIKEQKKKCNDKKKEFQAAAKENTSVLNDLTDSVKQTETVLGKCKQEYMNQVEKLFDIHVNTMKTVQANRVQDLERKKQSLESDIGKMEEVDSQVESLIASGSEYLITYKFSSLSRELKDLSKMNPVATDRALAYLKFESIPAYLPSPGYLMQREKWELANTFPTGLQKPCGIAINNDGDIAITSTDSKGVKVFSRTGKVKNPSVDYCAYNIPDIAVTQDNRYILAISSGNKGLQFNTREGKWLSNVPVNDNNEKKSNLISVAVDAKDQIIAGHEKKTISIHDKDGSLISKFATKFQPLCLAATSEGKIVCSYSDQRCLELLDYSGSHVKALQPPPKVKPWAPSYLCSRLGEIFVVSNPKSVFRYTAKGDYLGCVTTGLCNPKGIALSLDGMELFMVNGNQVMIFHRK